MFLDMYSPQRKKIIHFTSKRYLDMDSLHAGNITIVLGKIDELKQKSAGLFETVVTLMECVENIYPRLNGLQKQSVVIESTNKIFKPITIDLEMLIKLIIFCQSRSRKGIVENLDDSKIKMDDEIKFEIIVPDNFRLFINKLFTEKETNIFQMIKRIIQFVDTFNTTDQIKKQLIFEGIKSMGKSESFDALKYMIDRLYEGDFKLNQKMCCCY
jgi:hypothetical protein